MGNNRREAIFWTRSGDGSEAYIALQSLPLLAARSHNRGKIKADEGPGAWVPGPCCFAARHRQSPLLLSHQGFLTSANRLPAHRSALSSPGTCLACVSRVRTEPDPSTEPQTLLPCLIRGLHLPKVLSVLIAIRLSPFPFVKVAADRMGLLV